jgi:hypothetical protein
MSYERNMLEKLAMPTRQDVEQTLLKTLFRYNGIIKEFASGEEIVNEIADIFLLNDEQRAAVLERIYQKENRIVKTPLWHRLLYRAADALAKEKLVTIPTTTIKLTSKKEWMLTEKGFDTVLELQNISLEQKENFPVKSFEVQKEVKRIKETPCPENYNPVESKKKTQAVTKEVSIRSRSFRHAVIESYDFQCAVCGLKMMTPDSLNWEVEAAHIIPHSLNGKDDIWNGISLCRLHHWAFDAGWISLTDDLRVLLSSKINDIPNEYGKMWQNNIFGRELADNKQILLPVRNLYPHTTTVQWHREHIFHS